MMRTSNIFSASRTLILSAEGAKRDYTQASYVFSEVFDLKPTSGLSHAQSWLKNQAHLSNFLK